MSTFLGLEIAKSAIMTNQTALDITGHNVANANTEGYSRQVADVVTKTPWYTPSMTGNGAVGQMGTGVKIDSIKRVRDEFTDAQIRNETTNSGYWSTTETNLTQIENIVNDLSDDDLSTALTQFWAAWQDLSSNAENSSDRAVVAQRGEAVADAFQSTYKQLEQLRQDVNSDVKIDVDNINSDAEQIRDLNMQILSVSASGETPNDLEDKRDLLITNLSKLAGIKTTTDDKDMVSIQLDGRNLVDGVSYNTLTTVEDNQGMHMVEWSDTKTKVNFTGGEMRGLLDLRGKTEDEDSSSNYKETIPNLITQLNTMAKTVVEKTNQLHEQGYSLNNKGTAPDGTDFFAEPTADSGDVGFSTDKYIDWAKTIAVNSNIVNDPNNIAAANKATWSTDGTESSNFGDGSNALAIAKLKQSLNNGVVEQDTEDTTTLLSFPISGAINFSVNISGKTNSISISSSNYNTPDDVATAIAGAVKNAGLSVSDINVENKDGKLVFTSTDDNFQGISGLKIASNDVTASTPTANTIEVETGDIDFTGAPPISFQVNYGGKMVDINITSYTNTDDGRKTAIQDALNTNTDLQDLGMSNTAFKIIADGDKIDIYTSDTKFEGIYNLKTGTGASEKDYGDYQVMQVQNSTADDYWNSVVSNVGVKSQEATKMSTNQTTLLTQLNNKQQEESGVSLDEEMTNMIKYQQCYNAAARMVTTVDSELDTLINNMGLVGRG